MDTMTDLLTATEYRELTTEARKLVTRTIPEQVGRLALIPSLQTRLYAGSSVYRMQDIVRKLADVLTEAGQLDRLTADRWNADCQRMTDAAAALAGVPTEQMTAHAELMDVEDIIDHMK